MTLRDRLNEYLFNMETRQLLVSFGKSKNDIVNTMKTLNLNEKILNFQESSTSLYNSVMIRLQLYAEQDLDETHVRSSFSLLNNSYVNTLLDYLYGSSDMVDTSNNSQTNKLTSEGTAKVTNKSAGEGTEIVTQQPQKSDTQQNENKENDTQDESNGEDTDDDNQLEVFFEECVEQTNEPTDILKSSDLYEALTSWWSEKCWSESDKCPDKKELKEFLNGKLGKAKKSTWTNVVLK